MKYVYNKYKYFDTLVLLNQFITKNNFQEDIVREKDECELLVYDNMLENFYKNIRTENDINNIIALTLKLAGFIWFRQPFHDGNTRTLNLFLKLILLEFGYNIDIEFTNKRDSVLPIFYDDNDDIVESDIEKVKKRIYKINI